MDSDHRLNSSCLGSILRNRAPCTHRQPVKSRGTLPITASALYCRLSNSALRDALSIEGDLSDSAATHQSIDALSTPTLHGVHILIVFSLTRPLSCLMIIHRRRADDARFRRVVGLDWRPGRVYDL
jgi:hypothetical protein